MQAKLQAGTFWQRAREAKRLLIVLFGAACPLLGAVTVDMLTCGVALAQTKTAPPAAAATKSGQTITVTKIEYCRLTFPPLPIAEIVWSVAPGTGSARAINGKERVLAKGVVSIPKNIPIKVILQYDGMEHADSLDQLNQCLVSEFSAARLEFTDEQLAHIKNFHKLHNLNLDQTMVTDKSIPILATLTDLDELRLSSTDVEGKNLELLNSLHNLKNLNLFCTPLKEGSLAKIKPLLPSIGSIDLTNCKISKADAQYLPYLKVAGNINLNGNSAIDDSCMSLFGKLGNLITLELKDTEVTSKSLPILAKLPNLKTITVRALKFWPPGQPRPKLRPGLVVVDAAETCRTPIEVFHPVH